ncbi:TetR/AcrR family transcriptional regulator [Micromonospora carbonacea]|jgi:AcrR family transcriptional regulator|uniref:TetR/AcrR family transcriptional regulator n=1 Tax=Micromonospora carbonacea TaxID=47853 RepID=A0A1C5AV47_9ACTN|nr:MULTISPECIES: TetR/AcrR family transcriptional regulator [Micromonospora]MBB5827291.1 AcrR family transcriptional regulator [Micromonospora carbonacea]MDG4818771.1 TetR/AcrR family transcriptional regulator [Micromonospora sp. WMMD956]QLD24927.1 TetR/AcrR family transcriptional regulator [Micromonospora carbonacea]WFE61328.1 TetR/AcrR family transcriptional regulator [Micromonospora sp. WMMD712]SCF48904.1 transcriptional regulator, TetR family [Micromonospora carbonacea]
MARATSNRPESTRRRQRWPDGYDPENTRKSLIASALELFEKRGFDRTSVQEIADRAKLTKGAFYHHFESKDDLLRHIQEEYLEAQLAAIAKIEAGSDDPKVRVAELIRFSLTSVAEYRAHVTIFYQERRNLTADLFAEVTRKRSLVESAFAGMIADGVARGAFRSDVDPRIATFGLVGMCAWAYQWLNVGGPLSVEEVARQFSAMVLEGLHA